MDSPELYGGQFDAVKPSFGHVAAFSLRFCRGRAAFGRHQSAGAVELKRFGVARLGFRLFRSLTWSMTGSWQDRTKTCAWRGCRAQLGPVAVLGSRSHAVGELYAESAQRSTIRL